MDDFQTIKPEIRHKEGGQAMVEYALIIVFVVFAFAVTLAATGPAIGNVFSNVIHGVIGQDPSIPVVNLGTYGGPTSFWQTVTWVAANPQQETAYPTNPGQPTRATSTAFISPTPSQSHTPSNTPTETDTRTPTHTPTDFVPSPGPSQTPEDKEFQVPFADRADLEVNWRLDRSFVLNVGGWTGNYYNGSTCPGSDPDPGVTADTTLIRYDWGAGSPDAAINADGFVGCWTNTFNLNQPTELRFIAPELEGGTLRVTLDGGTTVLNASTAGDSAIFTLPDGEHTLDAVYTHSSGNAQVYLLMERPSQNPDDTTSSPEGCPFAAVVDEDPGSPFTNSGGGVFEDNPPLGLTNWPAGQTCVLELRGWVNSQTAPNAKLSFWDVWDFLAASGVSARLEIANYVESSPSVLDRSVWNSPIEVINLHTSGANYNWTRTEIDLSSIPGLSDKWTFRFVLNSSGGGMLSWYIDDIQVLNDPTPSRTFTVRDVWDLNSRTQMADFVFNADANYTREITAGAPPTGEWRWNLTTDRARNGTAWTLKDYVPSVAPTNNSPNTDRVYFMEFRYPIDVSSSRVPAVPTDDFDGDTGAPLLTFWHAYTGEDVTRVVEYALFSAPNTWIVADYLEPVAPSPLMTMQRNSVLLPTTEPFRLRFRLTIPQNITPQTGDGWFIDDIMIERDLGSSYANYPFEDSAESETFFRQNWTTASTWAPTTLVGGVLNSGTSYTDSPGTGVNYPANTESRLEMRRAIDLLGDSPDNPSPSAPAVHPMLTFWTRYDLQGTLAVDLWTADDDSWTTIWTMASPGARTRNNAWERVEIDIAAALGNVTGGSAEDDDIKIRFRLQGGANAYDGVYLDGIRISDKVERVHRLWNGGDGQYVDSIDTNSRGWSLQQAWHLGGTWNWTNETGHLYSGSLALADSPLQQYQLNWTSIAEMQPVFDLSGTNPADIPALNFFTRYDLKDSAQFQVEIATEQPGDSGAQVHNDMRGWSAWTPVTVYPSGTNAISNGTRYTMHRWRVDLRPYASANNRIRIRFVLKTGMAGALGDGVTIDEVSLTYGVNPVTPVSGYDWMDNNQWILEGSGNTRWGETPQFVPGGTGASADMGNQPWQGVYIDCETVLPTQNCDIDPTYTTLMNTITWQPLTSTGTPPAGVISAPTSPDLNIWINDGAHPPTVTDNAYLDTFAGRWQRNVVLQANTTYHFYAISNRGFRLSISNKSGITPDLPTIGGRHYLINAWFPHENQLDVRSITVGPANVTAVLTAEFFDIGGNSVISLANVTGGKSFTDSPNLPSGTGYTTVLSTRFGNSALTYRGFVNTTGGRTLNYSVLWDFTPNSRLYVEASTDGGFTWSPLQSIPPGGYGNSNMPPNANWLTRTIPLPQGPNVTFRFRLDTYSTGDSVTGDGIWISGISIN